MAKNTVKRYAVRLRYTIEVETEVDAYDDITARDTAYDEMRDAVPSSASLVDWNAESVREIKP